MNTYNNELCEMEIHCDECQEELVTEGTYQECVKQAQNEGWRIYFDDIENEFRHICPDCQKML